MPQPQDQTQALRQLYQSEDNPNIQSRENQDLWMQFRGPQGYQAQAKPDTGALAPLDLSSLLRHIVQVASTPQHPDQQTALRHLVQLAALGLPAGAIREPTTDSQASPQPTVGQILWNQIGKNYESREGIVPGQFDARSLLGVPLQGLPQQVPGMPGVTIMPGGGTIRQRDIQQYPQKSNGSGSTGYLGY